MEGYRSGHNEAVLKTVWAQAHKGSNPFPSAIYGNIRTQKYDTYLYMVFRELDVTKKATDISCFFCFNPL